MLNTDAVKKTSANVLAFSSRNDC